jgi:Ran GTPase-activating protein (RanGAP) involved in mRNA processing and transport
MGHDGSVLLREEAVGKATGQAGERIGRALRTRGVASKASSAMPKAIDCATKPLQWVTATMASVAYRR